MSISVILLAGGLGSRMKSETPKQFIPLLGKRLVLYSLDLFLTLPDVYEIVIVCPKGFEEIFPSNTPVPLRFASPGARRQDSLFNGFSSLSLDSSLVCIHDAARPLIKREDVEKAIAAARKYQAAVLATSVKMTIKEANTEGMVLRTLDRSTLFEIQTPQVITSELLKKGLQLAYERDLTVTDDVSLVELLGHPVKLVPGSYTNIKITTPDDLLIAEHLLRNEKI